MADRKRRKPSKSDPKRSRKPKQDTSSNPETDLLSVIGRGVVPPVLYDPARRVEVGVPAEDDKPGRYMVELNIKYRGGLHAASIAFRELYEKQLGKEYVTAHPPIEISKSYFKCWMSVEQWRKLIVADEQVAAREPSRRVIYKLWPDFRVKLLIDRSVATVKADAAFRSYAATGSGIAWAVIDSGIDGDHRHFGSKDDPRSSTIYHPEVVELHYDFTLEEAPIGDPPADMDAKAFEAMRDKRQREHDAKAQKQALVDQLGHGTHVAGIIAGRLPNKVLQAPLPNRAANEGAVAATAARNTPAGGLRYAVFEQVFEADQEGDRVFAAKSPIRRDVPRPDALHGVAPECLLVSLKVIDESGEGRVSDVMRALVYIREHLNDDPKLLRIHGVNMSIGYDFDAQMFACGQSPLCVEVDRLVRSGVVVVVAAGNTGYGNVSALQRTTMVGLSNTINDPGNSALAITVGSTHRDAPHTYGVSYFSSKGPTGDGRLKPDLVAPGERITSCASRSKCEKMKLDVDDTTAYIDDSGTSMAAPHVSGAIAAFLSIRREFIQRPEEVKRLFLENATSLGRERYFEGHGLVDLMRTIQSV
jgi:serine protease AprX